jgi:glycosyltransferase involved in cell wall biosynthesis
MSKIPSLAEIFHLEKNKDYSEALSLLEIYSSHHPESPNTHHIQSRLKAKAKVRIGTANLLVACSCQALRKGIGREYHFLLNNLEYKESFLLELEREQSYAGEQPVFRLHSINKNLETSFVSRVSLLDLAKYSPITIFTIEAINPALLSLVDVGKSQHKLIFIPNLEWLSHHYSVPSSPRFGLDFHSISNSKPLFDTLRSNKYRLLILARNQMTYNVLEKMNVPVLQVPWPIYNPEEHQDAPSETKAPGSIRLVFDLGNGGYGMRKAPDIAIDALLQTNEQYHVTIKLDPILAENFKSDLDRLNSKHILTIIDSWMDEHEINTLYYSHDCLVYPSRFDGHGLALERALANGLHVIHTDGEPWNSITLGYRRQLIKAEFKGSIDYCPYYEPSSLHLASLLDGLSLSELRAGNRIRVNYLYKTRRHHLISHLNAFLKIA